MTTTSADLESRVAALEEEMAELREKLEQSEIAAAMKEGIAQIERGEGVPAIEFVKHLGRKYGITRP